MSMPTVLSRKTATTGRLAIPAILRASLAVPAAVPQQQSPPVLYLSLSVLILTVLSAYRLLCAVSLGLSLLTAVCPGPALIYFRVVWIVWGRLADRSEIWRCCTMSCKALILVTQFALNARLNFVRRS